MIANSIQHLYCSLQGTLLLTAPPDSGRTVFVTLFSEIIGLDEKWDENIPVGLAPASMDVVYYPSVFSL